jgi:hypothetical protein
MVKIILIDNCQLTIRNKIKKRLVVSDGKQSTAAKSIDLFIIYFFCGPFSIAARAAANRAIGTRNGEQET